MQLLAQHAIAGASPRLEIPLQSTSGSSASYCSLGRPSDFEGSNPPEAQSVVKLEFAGSSPGAVFDPSMSMSSVNTQPSRSKDTKFTKWKPKIERERIRRWCKNVRGQLEREVSSKYQELR